MLTKTGDDTAPILMMTAEMYARLSPEERHRIFYEMLEKAMRADNSIYLPIPWRDKTRNLVGYRLIRTGPLQEPPTIGRS